MAAAPLPFPLRTAVVPLLAAVLAGAPASGETLGERVDAAAAGIEAQVIAWRRDFHEHPELGNRETRTGGRVAEHLASLGLEVRRGVAGTGVVGVLRGARPGPVVALRADMDALPVTEPPDLPFASHARATWMGQEVGVMHACGHDAHTAMLMGVAQLLAAERDALPGTVLFLFQPAEEGPPPGETGGARRMLAEGAFADPRPDAVLGLHVVPQLAAGQIGVRPGAAMASSDKLAITVHGSQTHAAWPWLGVDPIAAAARVVLAIEELPARQVDARVGSVVSIGAIHGGVRHNIIPDSVELLGTIRSLDPALQQQLHEKVRHTAEAVASASGASADVRIDLGYPITWNDPALTARVRESLLRAAGSGNVLEPLPRTGAEDFAFFAREVPGVYFWLGIRDPSLAEADAAPNHSPRFRIDESALLLGVRALSGATLDLLAQGVPAPAARD